MSDTTQPTVPAEESAPAEATQLPPSQPDAPRPSGPRLLGLPATGAGWWAFALELVFLVLLAVGTWLSSASMQAAMWGRLGLMGDIMFVATPAALVMSAVGGVLAISTLVRKRERSVLVWFAAVVFVLAVVVVIVSVL